MYQIFANDCPKTPQIKCIYPRSVTLKFTNNILVTLDLVSRGNLNKIIIGHLNINSIRNKFDRFVDKVKGNLDILMISETKLEDSFPMGQFYIDRFGTPIRLDRNKNGGSITLFV